MLTRTAGRCGENSEPSNPRAEEPDYCFDPLGGAVQVSGVL